MIIEICRGNDLALYEYFERLSAHVPYYFHTDIYSWRNSMFADCDYDSKPLFRELHTYALINDGNVAGFVQFGLTNFVFNQSGEKDYSKCYAVIRNMHFTEGAKGAHLLIEKAHEFFASVGIAERHAFFQFFGMSCYARQGKLHCSQTHIEEMLTRYGYRYEHENVYYSRRIPGDERFPDCDIELIDMGGWQEVTFAKHGETIGGCELYFVPQSDICFLKLIYINKELRHKGYGTACMYGLLSELQKRGVSRLDTDTPDSNLNAQGFYTKTGYADMGRMRSYMGSDSV